MQADAEVEGGRRSERQWEGESEREVLGYIRGLPSPSAISRSSEERRGRRACGAL